MDAQTKLNKDFPNEVVNKTFAILFLYKCIQVTMLTVFHNDIDCWSIYERIVVTYNEMRVKLGQHFNLL